METNDLSKMQAVVSGAGGEIGEAIAKKLKAYGAKLVLLDIDFLALSRVKEVIGDKCNVLQVDITDLDSVKSVAEQVKEQFGGADILVNNAGILAPRGATWEIKPDDFRKVLDVNLMGVLHCIQAFLPQLIKRQKDHGRARIVNMASYLGCEPQGFDSAYAASKAALMALSKSLSRELASEGLLVNCVAPTVVDNRMGREIPSSVLSDKIRNIPLGRPARTDEVAAMVAWLCSSECTFTTGAVFDVTGGRSSR